MSATPAIRIEGTVDRPEAAFLLVRYRKNGTTVWSYGPPTAVVYGQAVAFNISPVAPATLYNVELGYLSVHGEEPTSWRALTNVTSGSLVAEEIDGQGDLATLNDVDTPQIALNAATNASAQVNSTPVAIAYWGSFQTTFTELDSFTFTVSGEGEVVIQWTGMIEFNRSGSNLAEIYLTSGSPPETEIPEEGGGFIRTGYLQIARPRGNANSQAAGVTLTHVQALTAGTYTFKVYGGSDISTSQLPVSAGGKAFLVMELKR